METIWHLFVHLDKCACVYVLFIDSLLRFPWCILCTVSLICWWCVLCFLVSFVINFITHTATKQFPQIHLMMHRHDTNAHFFTPTHVLSDRYYMYCTRMVFGSCSYPGWPTVHYCPLSRIKTTPWVVKVDIWQHQIILASDLKHRMCYRE